MTEKQKLFCDYYLESLDAAKAARQAGYSEKTAASIAYVLMRKPALNEYMSKRMAEKKSILIASQDEVLETLTKIMRRDIYIEKTHLNKSSGKLETYKRYPTFTDIMRAAELLGKRYNMWNDRQIVEVADADIHVTIEGECEDLEEGDED